VEDRAVKLSRDEALFALNDHLGREVELFVVAEFGDTDLTPVSARGRLRRWHERRSEHAVSRPDLSGTYDIGNATLDVDDLGEAEWIMVEGDREPMGIRFRAKQSWQDLEGASAMRVEVTWGVSG